MSAKKIGKAFADMKLELWGIEGRNEKFLMNRRLIDTRSDVKNMRAEYVKVARKVPPSIRQKQKRNEFFEQRTVYKKRMDQVMLQAYAAVLQDSHEAPIPLRLDRDYEHKSDWRYCLYKGMIYQFDKAGYSDEEMLQQISKLNPIPN